MIVGQHYNAVFLDCGFGVPVWRLMEVYSSITVGFSPMSYCWPYQVCDYIGEPFWYHEESLSLQPMFPLKYFDKFPPEGECSMRSEFFQTLHQNYEYM